MNIVFGYIVSIVTIFIFFSITQNAYIGIAGAVIIFIVINFISYLITAIKENKLRNVSLDTIHNMTGIEFEKYLQVVLKKLGYKVQTTSKTGDFGADLILIKGKEKIVVQAKRYKGSVGIKSVQEVLGAKSYYAANDGWVITNSHFTKSAKELALKSNVKMIDKFELIKLAKKAGVTHEALYSHTVTSNIAEQSELPIQSIESSIVSGTDVSNTTYTHQNVVSIDALKNHKKTPVCPNCEGKMVQRTGKHGKFYGCTNFPKCKGNMPYKAK